MTRPDVEVLQFARELALEMAVVIPDTRLLSVDSVLARSESADWKTFMLFSCVESALLMLPSELAVVVDAAKRATKLVLAVLASPVVDT